MIYNYDDLEFKVLSIDRFFHKPGPLYVKARQYAAFSYRVSGSGEFDINGKHLKISPGDILFIPADVSYKVEYSTSESIVVHMLHCNQSEPEGICINNKPAVELLFQKLLTEWNKRHSVNCAKSIIYDILETVCEDKRLLGTDSEFTAALSFIEKNFCDPSLDMKAVSAHGYISVSTLQRKFKEHLGISPMQYVLKLRMNKAMDLLIANTLSVRDIAYSCGFSDEKYFSKAFRLKYGHSPLFVKSLAKASEYQA